MAVNTVTTGSGLPPHSAHTLEDWMVDHGPLAVETALVLAVDVCARVSRLPDDMLGLTLGSLAASEIVRAEQGGWTWRHKASRPQSRRLTDAEIIDRLGALLFQCVTGEPLAARFVAERVLRARLRGLRPDLPAAVVELIAASVSDGVGRAPTLAGFTRKAREVLGLQHEPRHVQQISSLVVVVSVAMALLVGAWTAPFGPERLESFGLTAREAGLVDIATETAQGLALMDEHTAGIVQYQQVARSWRSRLTPDDPRLAWIDASEVWVRTLAGDRITPEQVLETKPSWLDRELGARHPYGRAVRLALAATLEARGAAEKAEVLREQATTAARELFAGLLRAEDLLPGVPAPPGVIAHVAPNTPEREGFRRAAGGGFYTPLTSVQRWTAGRDGWRLHLIASGRCRTSFAPGDPPQSVNVSIDRQSNDGWQVGIEGTKTPVVLNISPRSRVGVSLTVDASGTVSARATDGLAQSAALDPTKSTAQPPYAFEFSQFGGSSDTGCDVVWLEIPLPFKPRA